MGVVFEARQRAALRPEVGGLRTCDVLGAVLRRRLPGHGDWPVPRAIRILQDLGWNGPWGVEMLSSDHRVRPLSESVPDVVRATLEQFRLAEALT